MKKVILVPALLGVMGIGGLIAVAGGNIVGSANSSEKLSPSQIEEKALAEVKGKITELELENEGSKLYYEVEVMTSDAEYDLKFDAYSGKLLKKRKDYHDTDDLAKYQQNNTSTSIFQDDAINGKNDDNEDKNTKSNTSTNTNENNNVTTQAPVNNKQMQDDDYYEDYYDDDYYEDDDDDDRYDDHDDSDDRYDDDDDNDRDDD